MLHREDKTYFDVENINNFIIWSTLQIGPPIFFGSSVVEIDLIIIELVLPQPR